MGQPDRELEDWKVSINLVAFALSCGYQLDLQQSSRHSKVLRRELDDDKIVVATSEQGHGVYFSIRDSNDHGTIIDFVQRRKQMNLGQVRQQLREWQHSSSPYCPVTPAAKPLPSAANHQQVLLELAGMENAPSDTGYLVNQRKISPVIMADARFYGVIKIDQKCNACLLYTSPSPRDRTRSRMPSSA